MQDAEYHLERVVMARWIGSYISPLGDVTPWIEGKAVIKKAFKLKAKFWWLLIRDRMTPITSDNTLTKEGAILVAFLMVDYDINFPAILTHELHDITFDDLTNFPFPSIFQRQYDEAGMPELLGIDERLPAIGLHKRGP